MKFASYVRLSMMRLLTTVPLILILAACSSPQKIKPKGPFFFPPPPDEPRIQFLTGFKNSSDFVKKSTFEVIVSGTERPEFEMGFYKPYGVAQYKGVIYVTDTVLGTVFLIDPVKQRFEPLRGIAGYGILKVPVDITVDEAGRIYVTDNIRKEVLIYTAEGDFVKAVGKGLEWKPAGIAVDKQNIYVAAMDKGVVKVLDRETGEFVRDISTGDTWETGLSLPTGLTMDSQGSLYATNQTSGRVIKFDVDGHVLASFGRLGKGFGEFSRPKGIAVDDQGVIYVVDNGFQNVQMFNQEKRLLLFFGSPGLARGSLNTPAGICVTKDNLDYYRQFADPSFELEHLIIVVNQFGEDRIAVYGFGHRKEAGSVPSAPGSSSNATTNK